MAPGSQAACLRHLYRCATIQCVRIHPGASLPDIWPGCGARRPARASHSLFELRPKLSGLMFVARYDRLLYQRLRILGATFDPVIWTMSLHCTSPAGRNLQSCRRYLPSCAFDTAFAARRAPSDTRGTDTPPSIHALLYGGRPPLAPVSMRMSRFSDYTI